MVFQIMKLYPSFTTVMPFEQVKLDINYKVQIMTARWQSNICFGCEQISADAMPQRPYKTKRVRLQPLLTKTKYKFSATQWLISELSKLDFILGLQKLSARWQINICFGFAQIFTEAMPQRSYITQRARLQLLLLKAKYNFSATLRLNSDFKRLDINLGVQKLSARWHIHICFDFTQIFADAVPQHFYKTMRAKLQPLLIKTNYIFRATQRLDSDLPKLYINLVVKKLSARWQINICFDFAQIFDETMPQRSIKPSAPCYSRPLSKQNTNSRHLVFKF